MEYIESDRCESLLTITPQWWASESVVPIRYEDLVADPYGEVEVALSRTAVTLDHSRIQELRQLDRDLGDYRKMHPGSYYHFWQGDPDSWMGVVPTEVIERTWHRHKPVFERLGYDIMNVPYLTESQAEANWRIEELRVLESQVKDLATHLQVQTKEVEHLREIVESPGGKLLMSGEIGPRGLRLAQMVSRLRKRFLKNW